MKKIRIVILLIFFIVTNQLLFSQNKKSNNQTSLQFPSASSFNKSVLTYKIINAPNNTYCYDIYADGRLMIHQPSIPGLSGNEGFKSKAQSEKIANLVISKIKKGEMPPSVTIEELRKLKAI
jgi:hypothetical protein